MPQQKKNEVSALSPQFATLDKFVAIDARFLETKLDLSAEKVASSCNGHVCKLEHLNLIIVNDDMDLENVKWLSDELEGAVRSFIDNSLAQKLGLSMKVVKPYYVKLADGHKIKNNVICPAAKWEIHKLNFQFNFRLMDLENWDMILGGRRFLLQGHSLATEDEIRAAKPTRFRVEQTVLAPDKRMSWCDDSERVNCLEEVMIITETNATAKCPKANKF
ncbi:OLC1v1001116C1 [Oldenlandia corymbosa var. corymbosa]|uniref:OLC1v1001116C1 n=1 Tax=Oldenlandia corymbosa var. corymbosa TaxID=529605 RepID=A0AAV1D5E0_OLDCO|nr:OLC1v1001116C1 [Oldenlandia corymbosa var. corymbosa]